MNKTQKDAIKQVIGRYEDNLYRYNIERQSKPNWVSGDGVPINTIIEELKAAIAELKEGLD